MIGFDIKWRGKRLGKDEWLIGSLYDDGGEYYILPPFPGSAIDYEDYQINPNTLGIWIGRNDKYGLPIYTGDLIRDWKDRVWRVELKKDQIQVVIVEVEKGIEKDPVIFKFEDCVVLETIYD